jgi:hypothetical protein
MISTEFPRAFFHRLGRYKGSACQYSDLGAAAYLIAPNVLFVLFWVKPWIALPLVVVATASVTRWAVALPPSSSQPSTKLAIIIILAAGLAACTGVIGGMGMPYDWIKHLGLVRDLDRTSWPVVLRGSAGESSLALRYSSAYYLAPAAAATVVGPAVDRLLIYGWTALGLIFFLGRYPIGREAREVQIFRIALLLLFSGADIVGTLVLGATKMSYTHLEWWAQYFQYSSLMTAVMWVPQHLLPAAIAVALLMDRETRVRIAPIMGLLLAALPLWSPFAALGILPITAVAVVQVIKHGGARMFLSWANLIAAPLLFAVVALYLSADTADIPQGPVWHFYPVSDLLWRVPLFLFVELGPILIALVALAGLRTELGFLISAGAFLMVLPLYRIGFYNDLVMRASLPALVCLLILIANAYSSGLPLWRRMLAAGCVLVGAATPVVELYRASFVPQPVWPEASLAQVSGPFLQQYYARCDRISDGSFAALRRSTLRICN